jgi:hypothetical protein
MMIDSDKKNFWTTMNILMEAYNRPPLSKESIIVWYNGLKSCEFNDLVNACDTWMKDQTKCPTIKDLLDLGRPKQDYYQALPVPRNEDIQKDGLEKINKLMENKPVKDYRSWARKIIANPKNYPDISFKFAQEALKHE